MSGRLVGTVPAKGMHAQAPSCLGKLLREKGRARLWKRASMLAAAASRLAVRPRACPASAASARSRAASRASRSSMAPRAAASSRQLPASSCARRHTVAMHTVHHGRLIEPGCLPIASNHNGCQLCCRFFSMWPFCLGRPPVRPHVKHPHDVTHGKSHMFTAGCFC